MTLNDQSSENADYALTTIYNLDPLQTYVLSGVYRVQPHLLAMPYTMAFMAVLGSDTEEIYSVEIDQMEETGWQPFEATFSDFSIAGGETTSATLGLYITAPDGISQYEVDVDKLTFGPRKAKVLTQIEP